MANFGDMNSVLCGARMPHLSWKRPYYFQKKMNLV